MKTEPKPTFNRNNIDTKFIRQVLHQTYPWGGSDGPKELLTARCLSGIDLKEYEEMLKYLSEKKLIQESGEPEYYFLTSRGEDVKNGSREL